MNDEDATIRVIQLGQGADEGSGPREVLGDLGEREQIAAGRRIVCLDTGFLHWTNPKPMG